MSQYFGAFGVVFAGAVFAGFSDSQGAAPTKNTHTFTVTGFRRVRYTFIVLYYRMPFNKGNRTGCSAAS